MSAADAAIADAVRLLGPLAGTKTTAGSTSTAAVDLSAFVGQNVVFSLTEPAHVRFGASDVGAATTDDVIFWSEQLTTVAIEMGRTHFRAIRQGSTDADIHTAPVSR